MNQVAPADVSCDISQAVVQDASGKLYDVFVTDTEAGHSEAVYTVTAVYDSSESAYSNEAVLTTTGISRPDADATATESARYAIDGRRLDAPERGVNIVRMTDGKVRKVIVR